MTSNPNSPDFDYKKYSLQRLQDWVHDALSTSEASPHEIYSAIREAVREDYYYYKDYCSRASGLLELLSGHRPVKDAKWDEWEETYYPEEYYYTATGEKWPSTPVKYDEHMKSYAPYAGSTVSSVKQDKPKKWVLPVEEVQDAETGKDEYYVAFPDDLLEAADLKEGDQVEWVDQGDGSYLLKKVEQPSWVRGNELARVKTYQEMIDDGWTMTDDGFWMKETITMDEC